MAVRLPDRRCGTRYLQLKAISVVNPSQAVIFRSRMRAVFTSGVQLLFKFRRTRMA